MQTNPENGSGAPCQLVTFLYLLSRFILKGTACKCFVMGFYVLTRAMTGRPAVVTCHQAGQWSVTQKVVSGSTVHLRPLWDVYSHSISAEVIYSPEWPCSRSCLSLINPADWLWPTVSCFVNLKPLTSLGPVRTNWHVELYGLTRMNYPR